MINANHKPLPILRALMLSLLCAVFMLLPLKAMAVIETYQFKEDDGKKRYQTLVHELRCPKCQNQNLSGSNSPIAKDLRRELHRMIESGDNDEQIKAFMVKRYGNFVLYRPPVDKNTIWLWGSPILLAMLALLFVVFLRRSQRQGDAGSALSQQEQLRLQSILQKYR